MSPINRRKFVRVVGAGAAIGSGIGTVQAGNHGRNRSNNTGELRLFSEVEVGNSHELVTQGIYAYIATGDGFGVIDWRNPGRPEVIAERTVPESEPDILDVKVDGDLLGVAYNGGPGVRFYDIGDPSDPQGTSFYDAGSGIHNLFIDGDYAYLTINSFFDPRTEIVDVSDPSNPSQAGVYRLADDFPEFTQAATNPVHDIYVQDDLLYQVFWDAGTVIADVSDKSEPQLVTQFGDVDGADSNFFDVPYTNYLKRYLGAPGNAHYVQPSPDGDYVFVGAETFPGPYPIDLDGDGENEVVEIPGGYGGIDIWDVTDTDNPEVIATIDPPEVEDDVFRTSHNFDVTNDRLYSSWYNGGVRVHDITDPEDPRETYAYDPDGYSFWTTVRGRGFTIGGVYGALSEKGGAVILHEDRGKNTPPGFESADPPIDPEPGIAER